MKLVIQAPPTYEIERRYILDVVLSDWLGIDWLLDIGDRPDIRITAAGEPDEHGVVLPDTFFGTVAHEWLTAASLPAAGLPRPRVGSRVGPGVGTGADHSRTLGADERLPAVFGTDDLSAPRSTLLRFGPGSARVEVDVFGTAFFMLTRYEEAVVPERDSLDRFPAASSVAGREGFLTTPIVDAYVEILWAALEHVWPRLRRAERGYGVLMTHDVDDPLSTLGRGPDLVARQFATDLVRRRSPGLAFRRARSLLSAARGDHRRDPHNTFDLIMDTSERHGLRSAFYFLADSRVHSRAADAVHILGDPWVRRLVGQVHRRGHEVGFHAGWDTYLDSARISSEFEALRDVAQEQGVPAQRWGGRQHYLQWANPTTWRAWDDAGLSYDCSLAYAETVGFRTGTCHEFPVFDVTARAPLGLRERPFQVMDAALFHYMGLSEADAADAVLGVARECRRYQGSLGILWHNDELLTAAQQRWYRSMVAAVASPG